MRVGVGNPEYVRLTTDTSPACLESEVAFDALCVPGVPAVPTRLRPSIGFLGSDLGENPTVIGACL
jgi:hypothetical protein